MDAVSTLRIERAHQRRPIDTIVEMDSPCALFLTSICVFVSRCILAVFHTINGRLDSLLCLKLKLRSMSEASSHVSEIPSSEKSRVAKS